MLRRTLTIFTAALVLIAAGLLGLSHAEAGPPDHYADLSVDAVELSSGCVAKVWWSGLNGGKPLFIEVRLTFNNGSTYQTSFGPGADVIHKMQQNAGYLEVDLSGAAALDPTTDHRISVSFMDRRGNQLRPTSEDTTVC